MRIALITARGGSKGLPRKNILPLLGIPLIGWTINAALKATSIDAVYVSTDDDEIAEVSRKFGALVIPRPIELARDDTSSEPVIAHAFEYLKNQGVVVTLMFLLQPTSPVRTSEHIEEAYEVYKEKLADCVLSVFEPEHSPAKAYKLNDNGTIEGILFEDAPYSRRQDLPQTFQPNGAIYIFTGVAFMDKKQIPRVNVYPYIMSKESSIDIDTKEELQEAILFLERECK